MDKKSPQPEYPIKVNPNGWDTSFLEQAVRENPFRLADYLKFARENEAELTRKYEAWLMTAPDD